MDPTTWIGAVTALGALVKTWIDARKSGVDLQKAKLEIASKATSQLQQSPSEPLRIDAEQIASIVIDQDLLGQLLADIRAAKDRFAAVFTDPRYTPADIDREEERARLSVCAHLKRIREFNAGVLPSAEMEALSVSFRCEG